ncbi:OFA family MFS transporter [Candidatus Bathyarchaeota archaeon]|nr:OFA family MFS transporter [Candidatus Bathyarchaeota archaeon]
MYGCGARREQRWVLLAGATIVMAFIAIYQYSWSLFALGLSVDLKWPMTTVQLAFTLYTYVATFVQPLSGYFADKFGPKKLSVLAGLLAATGFLLSSRVTSPLELYIYYTIGSVGVGVLYGVSTAIAVKWFSDRRGMAAGIVTFGFGSGTAIFNPLIQSWIINYGVRCAFLYVGALMLAFILPFALLYRYPEIDNQGDWRAERGDNVNWKWYEMLKTWQWWLIYISFIAMSAIALLFGAQIAPMAEANNMPRDMLSLVLIAYPIANGFSRVLGGWISDYIGRQLTATLFYALSGVSMIALGLTASNPLCFALFVVLAMLFAGSVFAFNPAIVGDFYGSKYLTTNYGITYTAKSWGGLVSGYVTAYLLMLQKSYTSIVMALGAGALAAALLINPFLLKKPGKPTLT